MLHCVVCKIILKCFPLSFPLDLVCPNSQKLEQICMVFNHFYSSSRSQGLSLIEHSNSGIFDSRKCT